LKTTVLPAAIVIVGDVVPQVAVTAVWTVTFGDDESAVKVPPEL
jgi:hypothetical protein